MLSLKIMKVKLCTIGKPFWIFLYDAQIWSCCFLSVVYMFNISGLTPENHFFRHLSLKIDQSFCFGSVAGLCVSLSINHAQLKLPKIVCNGGLGGGGRVFSPFILQWQWTAETVVPVASSAERRAESLVVSQTDLNTICLAVAVAKDCY